MLSRTRLASSGVPTRTSTRSRKPGLDCRDAFDVQRDRDDGLAPRFTGRSPQRGRTDPPNGQQREQCQRLPHQKAWRTRISSA